jgi:predicted amidohydrolase
VDWCESHDVAILCCPEAFLGGLTDNAADPRECAIDAHSDQLGRSLAPLASDTVTTIVGFTEATGTGRLHNTAAVFHRGAEKGATALFIPTNNGLAPEKADVAAHARKVDIALAIEHGVFVIRADVAGRADGLVSYGSSGIVDSRGRVLQSTQPLTEGLIVADLEVSLPQPRAI